MIRIGIVGSDNSHAEAFSKLFNLPDPATGAMLFPQAQVAGIYGLDAARTEQVARDAQIPYIAPKAEDLLGKVDAVMTVFRHGDLHYANTLPFIQAGLPCWVDKPFTRTREDARAMLDAAQKYGALLTGGSTLKLIPDTQMLKSAALYGSRIGKLRAATLHYAASMENEYGGLCFYGAHLAEVVLEAFGYDAQSVTATLHEGVVTATVRYARYPITLQFVPDLYDAGAILYGEGKVMTRELDITRCYIGAARQLVTMVETRREPFPPENLYRAVDLMSAIEEACTTGKEIMLGA